jgi:hypothetical protein
MVAVTIKSFNGMRPIAHPLQLQPNEAQLAQNVRLISGAIAAMRGTTTLKATTTTLPQTIYRFGSSSNESNYWLEFAGDVDVMRSPIVQDQWDRVYWSDGAKPKYGANDVVLSGGSYPGGSYLLGVPAPATAPSVTGYTAPATYTAVDRQYVMTYYKPSSTKESSASAVLTVKGVDGQPVTLTLPTGNGGDAGITKKRLYRKVGATFRRIAELDVTVATYKDEATDASLAGATALPTGVEARPTAPTSAPIAAADVVNYTGEAKQYSYVYTVKNVWTQTGSGDSLQDNYYAESAPSAPVTVNADQTQTVTLSGLSAAGTTPSSGTMFRVYRKAVVSDVGGSWVDAIGAAIRNDSVFRFVGETSSSTFSDVLPTSHVSIGFPQLNQDAPDTVKPTSTPTASVNTSTAVTPAKRIYAVTFVDASGNESSPSPASGVIEAIDGATTVTVRHTETAPSGATLRRLYRQTVTVSGGSITSSDANYKKVADNPIQTTTFSDKIADVGLGAAMPSGIRDLPPSPTESVAGSATIPSSVVPEVRTYVYTYVTAYGEEGPPSAASASASIDATQSVTVSLPGGAPAGAYNITIKRLYRSSTAANGQTQFQYVAEVPVATTSYTDAVKQANLGEVLPSEDWTAPPDGLKGLRMMANGVAVGFVGNSVWMSEPNLPHAWPHSYSVPDEIVGIGTFGQAVVVLTRSVPYLIEGIDPAAMATRKLELKQACSSKRSIVEAGDGVVYASPDGLVSIGAGGITVLTKTLFSREQWLNYSPSTMQVYLHNGRYHVFYTDAQSVRGLMILDFSGQGAVLTLSDLPKTVAVTAGYQDASTDTLYLAQGGNIVRFDAGTSATYTWRSKVFRLPHHANFTLAQVRALAYPVTFKAYADGVLKVTQTVSSDEFFRLPGGFKAVDWVFEVSGTNEVTEINVCTSVSELMSA